MIKKQRPPFQAIPQLPAATANCSREDSQQRRRSVFCDMRDGVSELKPLALNLFGNIENWPDGFFGIEFEEMAAMTRATMQLELKGKRVHHEIRCRCGYKRSCGCQS